MLKNSVFFFCYGGALEGRPLFFLRQKLEILGFRLQFVKKTRLKAFGQVNCNYLLVPLNKKNYNLGKVEAFLEDKGFVLLGLHSNQVLYSMSHVRKANYSAAFSATQLLGMRTRAMSPSFLALKGLWASLSLKKKEGG